MNRVKGRSRKRDLRSPMVSIVMPTYNRASLLPRTIESILGQSYSNFRLLIIDDGSNDNTNEVIKEIQKGDLRLEYLQLEQNRGIGFARDIGLLHASGKYVALADSDDLWLSEKLKLQVEAMEKYTEIDILFSDWWNIDHVKATVNRGFEDTYAGMQNLVVHPVADGLWIVESGVEAGILRSNFIQPATMVLRKSVFEKVGRFEAALVTSADHEFGWRAAVLGARYAYLDQVLVERHRLQSSVTAQSVASSMSVLKALEICRSRARELPDRPELLDHIRTAEHRSWRNIIRKHTEDGRRDKVWRAYIASLRYGFSLRTFAFFVIGLGGPLPMSFALKLRRATMWAFQI
jgi:glycosyltransferase involved in cell wall biosynthesis